MGLLLLPRRPGVVDPDHGHSVRARSRRSSTAPADPCASRHRQADALARAEARHSLQTRECADSHERRRRRTDDSSLVTDALTRGRCRTYTPLRAWSTHRGMATTSDITMPL